MRILPFDPQVVGRAIDRFESANVLLSPIARFTGPGQIGCFYLGPQGVVGYHQAAIPQLFLVVQGEGWVRGEAPDGAVPISAGQAAFWEAGEWHESRSDTGMLAIVIESEALDPAAIMPGEARFPPA